MKTEDRRVCPSCGNEFSGAVELESAPKITTIGRTIGGQIHTVSSRFFAFRDESAFFGDPSAEPLFKPLQRDFRVVAGEGIEPPTRGFSVRRFYSVVDIQ
jgi:hypothetical protein